MAYLGNSPARSFISFERQVFTIVNSQTAYTLDHSVTNENDIRLVVNNVVQEPGSGKAYTASGTTLTLSAALTNGTDEMYCVYLGRATATEAPGAGSVGTSQLASDAVTEAKIADGAVESEHLNNNVISGQTELASEPADTDEFLVSDAWTLKRLDYSLIKAATPVAGTLSFQAYRSGNLAVSATTQTELVYNAEVTDPSSKYDTSTGRYTPGVAGTYFVNAGVSFAPDSNIGVGASGYLKIRKSGSGTVEYGQISNQGSGDSNDEAWNTAAVIELGSSDYISVWWYHTATAGNMLSVQSWFSGFRIG